MNKNQWLIGILWTISSLTAIGQQNFFNVPSSDITPPQKLFVQQQINATSFGLQSGTTFCFGLGHNFEIGANVLGINYDYKNQFTLDKDAIPISPVFALNAQKKIHVNEYWAWGLGGQLGINPSFTNGLYAFSNLVYDQEDSGTKFVSGLYYTSDSYFGPETRNFSDQSGFNSIGIQLGLEQNLWKEKLVFQADFISGKHSLGELVVGGAYFLTKNWVISAGYQIPTFQSKSVQALVFELTFIPH